MVPAPDAGPVASAPGALDPSAPAATRTSLTDCVRSAQAGLVEDDPRLDACLEDALLAQARATSVAGATALMAQSGQLDPRLTGLCHRAAHGAFRQYFREQEQARPGVGTVLLGEAMSAAVHGCLDGAVHGLLEGWVGTGPDVADLEELAGHCAAPGALPSARAGLMRGCADALGHAVWARWQAPDPCAVFDGPELQRFCAQGVVMQMWRPVGSAPGTASAPLEDLLELCASGWPASVPVDGCYLGVAYAFEQPVSAELSRQLQALPQGAAPGAEAVAAVARELDGAIAWCARLAGDDAHVCHDGLLVSPQLRQLGEQDVRGLCGRLAPRWQGRCVDRFSGRLAQQGQTTPPA